MLKPPPRTKQDYEKVDTEDWVTGVIEEIQSDEKRDTGFKDEDTGEPIIKHMIRFKFKLEGYHYPHYSRWMALSYHEKANLYKKYLFNLVAGAAPDMDFDLESLEGCPVKMMWSNNGDFQNIEMIRPVGAKVEAAKLPF